MIPLKNIRKSLALEFPPSADIRSGFHWFFMGRLIVLYSLLIVLVTSQVFQKGELQGRAYFWGYGLLGFEFLLTLVQSWDLQGKRTLWLGTLASICFDSAVITAWIVGAEVNLFLFAFLYLIQILVVALTFYQRSALTTSILACVLFGGILYFRPGYAEDPLLTWVIYSGVFLTLGIVGGYLSEELVRTTQSLKDKSRELDQLAELQERIISGMPTGLITIDSNTAVSFMNPSAEHILNLHAKESVSKPLSQVCPDLLPFFEQLETKAIETEDGDSDGMDTELSATGTDWHRSVFLKARMEKGQARLQQTVEFGTGKNRRILRGDVADLDVSVGKFLGGMAAGGRVLLFQDVTKLVHLEEKLKQHEKLAAVGQLAAGIAHEIRNPLASMSASIQMLKEKGSEELVAGENQKLMEIVIREIDRLNGLITEFLDFVKPDHMQLSSVDLSRLLNEVGVALSHWKEFQNRVTLEVKCTSGTLAFANPEKLKQVIWNLLTNGVQAMKNPGKLEVGCDSVNAHWVRFWVEDQGQGMSEEVLQHLYEPFFTTKDRGTGLGLATVYKIIEGHQGEIRVTSKVGVGTRFEIHLHKG